MKPAEMPTPNKCGTNFNWKPTEKQRSIADAVKSAERRREDLPHVVQVYARDWDTVILADALSAANEKLARLRELVWAVDTENYCIVCNDVGDANWFDLRAELEKNDETAPK